MYEIINSLTSVIGGVVIYLIGTGKIESWEKKKGIKELREKMGSTLKIVGILLIAFGVYQLFLK